MGHGEASQCPWEAMAESGAWLSPALLCPRRGCLGGRCLELLPQLLPVQQLCPVLPLQGGTGLEQGCREGRDAGEAISVSVPDKQMEAALSYYLRAKREKLSGVLRLAGQWALGAPAAAGCFSGVAATPTPAPDSVCTGQHRVPGNRSGTHSCDMGSAPAALDPALCCWGLGGFGGEAWRLQSRGAGAVQGLSERVVAMMRGQMVLAAAGLSGLLCGLCSSWRSSGFLLLAVSRSS